MENNQDNEEGEIIWKIKSKVYNDGCIVIGNEYIVKQPHINKTVVIRNKHDNNVWKITVKLKKPITRVMIGYSFDEITTTKLNIQKLENQIERKVPTIIKRKFIKKVPVYIGLPSKK